MNEASNEPILSGINQFNFTLCYRMTHRFRWPHSMRQQYQRSYCATTEMQEYPEEYLSAVEYNSKNCWLKMDNRVRSDGVWRSEDSLPNNRSWTAVKLRGVFKFAKVRHSTLSGYWRSLWTLLNTISSYQNVGFTLEHLDYDMTIWSASFENVLRILLYESLSQGGGNKKVTENSSGCTCWY